MQRMCGCCVVSSSRKNAGISSSSDVSGFPGRQDCLMLPSLSNNRKNEYPFYDISALECIKFWYNCDYIYYNSVVCNAPGGFLSIESQGGRGSCLAGSFLGEIKVPFNG